MTSRELVYKTLEFENKSDRIPTQMTWLPWAENNYPSMMRKIQKEYPDDIVWAPIVLPRPTIAKGDMNAIGEYTDDWGCKFENIHEGIHGEIKDPLVKDEEWLDVDNVHIPVEWLDFDVDVVNAFCRNSDKFILAGNKARPFERLQFIRKTEDLFMDLVEPPENMLRFMQKMHTFYCDLMEKWAKTEVDSLYLMDDWGSQTALLINPVMWDKLFKPMYKDYIDIAKRYGKRTFMHSDGYTLDLYPRMIELGLDAFNTQLFCIGLDKLEQFKGKITFWGEIDRQHLLVNGTQQDICNAVNEVYEKLWDNGGCIGECEFGPGANPDNVYEVFRAWNAIKR